MPDQSTGPYPGGRENIVTPHPDPTLLTTEQLRMTEIGLRREIESLANIITTRLEGMDEATKIRLAEVNRYPSKLEDEVHHLNRLIDHQFASTAKNHDKDIANLKEVLSDDVINLRSIIAEAEARVIGLLDKDTASIRQSLSERDARFKSDADSAQKALELATLAPASAADRVEKSMDRQITTLQAQIKTDKESADKIISAITSRLDRLDGAALGSTTAQSSQDRLSNQTRSNQTLLISLLVLVLMLAGIMVTVMVTKK